jgi:hypothetical protein
LLFLMLTRTTGENCSILMGRREWWCSFNGMSLIFRVFKNISKLRLNFGLFLGWQNLRNLPRVITFCSGEWRQ